MMPRPMHFSSDCTTGFFRVCEELPVVNGYTANGKTETAGQVMNSSSAPLFVEGSYFK